MHKEPQLEPLFTAVASCIAEVVGRPVDIASLRSSSNGVWHVSYGYDGTDGNCRSARMDFTARMSFGDNHVDIEDFTQV